MNAEAWDELFREIEPLAPGEAIAIVLERWKLERDDALAEVVVRLDELEPREEIAGSVDERLALWRRLVDEGSISSVGRAIRAFPIGLIADGTDQLARLQRLADPRVGDRIARMLDDPPYRSPKARPFWQRALAVAADAQDGRALRLIRERREAVRRELAHPMNEWVAADIDAAPAPPTAVEVPSCRAFLDRLAKRRLADASATGLLEAIYAAPHDDAARHVYADRLAELGDPRGEFINLQLHRAQHGRTREGARRENELLSLHEQRWLGELAPVILKTGIKFERGFLEACHLRAKSEAAVRKAIGSREWVTVRRITEESSSFNVAALVDTLLLHPVMKSLRILDGQCSRSLFRALCLGAVERPIVALRHGQLSMRPSMSWSEGRGWTKLPPDGPEFDPEEKLALTDCPGLPNLRDLDISGAYQRVPPRFLHWLLDGALGRRLVKLTLLTTEDLIPDWIEALRNRPLPELVVRGNDLESTYVVTRDGARASMSVSFRICNMRASYREGELISPFNDFLRMLPSLAAVPLSKLELAWAKKSAPTSIQLASLEPLLARLDVERTIVPDHG